MTEGWRDGRWEQGKAKKEGNQMASVRVTKTKNIAPQRKGKWESNWLIIR